MLVSNTAILRVGDGFRTPGMPVPEAEGWDNFILIEEMRQRKIVDVSESVAEDMRQRYAKKVEEQKVLTLKMEYDAAVSRVNQLAHKAVIANKDKDEIKKRLEDATLVEMELAEKLGIRDRPKQDVVVAQETPVIALPPKETKEEIYMRLKEMSRFELIQTATSEFNLGVDTKKKTSEIIKDILETAK